MRGASDCHGARRPAVVLRHRRDAPAGRGASSTARGELGIPRNDDFNGATQEGAGYYQLTTRNGWRCSTAVGVPASRRAAAPNLRVETDAHATRVLVRRHGARSACATGRAAQTARRARAREVILAAGALQSPQLLQLSGIGPAALLQQHGIPVVHDAAAASARTCRTTCRRA